MAKVQDIAETLADVIREVIPQDRQAVLLNQLEGVQTDYTELSQSELEATASARGIDPSGKREDVEARLEAQDEEGEDE